MDLEATELAKDLVERLTGISPQKRLIVGISGIPASGKSTFTRVLVERVNALLLEQHSKDRCVVVELDGWHLTRAQLDALPHPQLAHDRRGAHWTFDGQSYVEFVSSLREQDETVVLTAPTFDHALKDPTPHAISIHSFHRIVLIEGLYAFLSIEPWQTASRLLDERWWIEVEDEEARRRLAKRHVVSGITKDEEAALDRADHNDLPNGKFIQDNMLPPTRVIHSS